MSALAPTLQAFFTDRLVRQRQVSANTIAAYRDTLRLLLTFTPCSASPHWSIPNTPTASVESWRSHPNASTMP